MSRFDRKRLQLMTGGLIFAVVLSSVSLFERCRNRVTPGNVLRLRYGMTTAEVIGILGRPARSQIKKGLVLGPDHYYFSGAFEDGDCPAECQDFVDYDWQSEELSVGVRFNPEGQAITLTSLPRPRWIRPWYELTIRRIRQWVGL